MDTTASPPQALGTQVQFTYAITNTGISDILSLQVTDAFGPVDVSGVALPIKPGEVRLLTVQYTLTGPITNTVTVLANGGLCAAAGESVILQEQPPISCCVDGRPTGLLMEYTAAGCGATRHSQEPGKVSCADSGPLPDLAYIIANDSDSPTSGRIWFSGWVNKGGLFLISAARGGATTLSTDTRLHIYNADPAAGGVRVEFVKFHTSCSQPLAVGDQYGSALLRACDGAPPPPAAALGWIARATCSPARSPTAAATTCSTRWRPGTTSSNSSRQPGTRSARPCRAATRRWTATPTRPRAGRPA